MRLLTSLHLSATLLAAPLFFVACGGVTRSDETTPPADAGIDSAASHDSGVDAACASSPVEGAACTPGVSTACAQDGDPCCIGYVWTCSEETGAWSKEELGCACRADAGATLDSSTTRDAGSEDAESGDASTAACGTCDPGDICVVSTSGGGPCVIPPDGGTCPNGDPPPAGGGCCDNSSTTTTCQPRPTSCGGGLTCGCAASLCECMCSGASGDTLQCACEFP